jgi:enoyl-CoA hydratase
MFDPEGAREAGLLDAVVTPEDLETASRAAATDLATVDRRAHAGTKQRARKEVADELRAAIESELAPRATT